METERLNDTTLVFLNKILVTLNADFTLDHQNVSHWQDKDLEEIGLLDSMKLIRLVTYIEQEYNYRFGGSQLELEYFRSLHTLSDFYLQHIHHD